MHFYMPAKVYHESNCVLNHARELAQLGTHALIVTGRNSSRKNHSLFDAQDALESQKVAFTVFDQVEENPSVETVFAARTAGIEAGADFVVGIGGGSPLDAAKAAALLLNNPECGTELLYHSVPAKAAPVAAIPTTCGTGSEVTGVSVLTRSDLQTKMSITHKIFPKLALIDGKYLLNAPRRILVNTAVDALSHLIESIINTKADRYSEMTAYTGLRTWGQCINIIQGHEELTVESAQTLMYASTVAGISIAQTGTAIPHALSYYLTARGGIPHGAAVGAFQENYLRKADETKKRSVLQSVGLASTEKLGILIRELTPVTVSTELLKESAESVLGNPQKIKLCPYPLDARVMQELISI